MAAQLKKILICQEPIDALSCYITARERIAEVISILDFLYELPILQQLQTECTSQFRESSFDHQFFNFPSSRRMVLHHDLKGGHLMGR